MNCSTWNNRRGVIPAIYLVGIAVVGIFLLIPSWKLPAFLQRKPPVAQLSQAEIDLAKSKADLAAAQAKLDAAKTQEEAKTHEQITYSQQMVAGIPVALAHAPSGPEVALATSLANRASVGLSAALGGLAPDKQAEIEAIVGQALSAKQAEVDAANKALAAKDAELAATTQAKRALEGQLPALKASVEAANAQVGVKDALVAERTAQVAQWASLKSEAEQKAGSLQAYGSNLFRILLIIGILYAICHFILPCLAAEFPASKSLSAIYRTVTSLTSAHEITDQPKT